MNDRELRKQAIEMMKDSKSQDWTDILSMLIRIVVWLVPIGCIVVLIASIPVYDAFTKEYKSEERLIRAVGRVNEELYYPESMADQWSDVSWQGILDGRNIFSRLRGYKVIGKLTRENTDYNIAIQGEVLSNPENMMGVGDYEYQGVEYSISPIRYECQAYIFRDEIMYILFMGPCEVDGNLDPASYKTEDVLMELVREFIASL